MSFQVIGQSRPGVRPLLVALAMALASAVALPRLCAAQSADDVTPAEKTIHLPTAEPKALKPVPAPTPVVDVALPMDVRGVRAAGISTAAIERERGGTDLFLPGTIAIPQQQIRVVAAPAGGLVESMAPAADEPVTAGERVQPRRLPAHVVDGHHEHAEPAEQVDAQIAPAGGVRRALVAPALRRGGGLAQRRFDAHQRRFIPVALP